MKFRGNFVSLSWGKWNVFTALLHLTSFDKYGTPLLPHYIELYFVRSVLRIFMCRLYYLMSNDVLVRCILVMGMTECKAVMSDSRFVRYFLHILMRNCWFIWSLHYTILCKYHYIMFNSVIVRCVHHSVIPKCNDAIIHHHCVMLNR